MSEEVILDITTVEETVTIDTTDPEVIEIKVVSVSGSTSWNDISDKPTAFPPTAHKSTHAIGGSDALSPADIGAQPAGNYATGGGTATGTNTGDQTITLTGDVTGSGTSTFTATIANDAVTFSKMAHIASGTIIGRHASGMGSPQSITIDGGLVLQGGKLELSDIGTAGIYKSVTVDGKGRVTAGTNPTTLAGYGITDAAALVHTHGNISNGGAIGTTADLAVVTGSGGALTVTSRSGIDSRASFPNADVTAATWAATPNTIVKRSASGEVQIDTVTAGTVQSEILYSSTGLTSEGATQIVGSLALSGTTFTYGAGSASAHRTALGLTSLATTTAGTGVTTALAINVGSSGAFVVNGGALGTPSSGTLTNATGLPISTGVAGLGSGVATFLATPTSANLAAAVTDELGDGRLLFEGAIPSIVSNTATLTPAVAIYNDFTNGAFGFQLAQVGTGSNGDNSVFPSQAVGVMFENTGAVSGNYRCQFSRIGGSMLTIQKWCFAIPNINNMRVRLGQTWVGNQHFGITYNSTLNGGRFFLGNTGSGIDVADNILADLGVTPEVGNFVSGTRYLAVIDRISSTQTAVQLYSAPHNTNVWTLLFNQTVTHASLTLSNVGPTYLVQTYEAVAKTLAIDFVVSTTKNQR